MEMTKNIIEKWIISRPKAFGKITFVKKLKNSSGVFRIAASMPH